jgi:hypothetical protein
VEKGETRSKLPGSYSCSSRGWRLSHLITLVCNGESDVEFVWYVEATELGLDLVRKLPLLREVEVGRGIDKECDGSVGDRGCCDQSCQSLLEFELAMKVRFKPPPRVAVGGWGYLADSSNGRPKHSWLLVCDLSMVLIRPVVN